MNAKNTKKNQSPIHENSDANITCAFGDGDISRSKSRFTHTHGGVMSFVISLNDITHLYLLLINCAVNACLVLKLYTIRS